MRASSMLEFAERRWWNALTLVKLASCISHVNSLSCDSMIAEIDCATNPLILQVFVDTKRFPGITALCMLAVHICVVHVWSRYVGGVDTPAQVVASSDDF